MKSQQLKRTIPWFLIAVFLLLVFVTLVGGVLFYQTQQKRMKSEAQNYLAAIADLKVGQINQWRRERLVDGELLFHNVPFLKTVEAFLKSSSATGQKQELLTVMRSFQHEVGYESAFILDAKGKIRLAVSRSGDSVGIRARSLFQEVHHRRKVLLSDLHKSGPFPLAHMDLMVPLFSPDRSDSVLIGVFMLRIDPQIDFFPLIQTWPTPSRTSETFLFEQERDSIVYLNELRHQKNTTLTLHLPISNEQLTASMAVRGTERNVEGKDYRNVPVLAAIRKIQNTPWFMIAKVDQEEIYVPLRSQTWIAVIGMFLFLLAAGGIILSLWRHQSAKFYRDKYLAEVERQALIKHFDYIIKYANDSIVLFDMDGKIVETNDQACRMYGYTRNELDHLYVRDLRSEQTRPQVEKQLNQVEVQGGLVFETEHRRKDGTVFPVEISSRFIKIDKQRFYQSIIRDITERKRAEEFLMESEDRFRRIFEEGPLGMATSGADFKFLKANTAFCTMMGYEENEITSLTFKDITHPDHITQDVGSIKNLLAGKISLYRTEKRYIRKDKRIVWGAATVSVIRDRNNQLLYFLVMIEDITDRKHAEEALRESEERYRQLFDLSPDTIFIQSEGSIAFINEAGVQLFGATSKEELIGRRVVDLMHPDYREIVTKRINQLRDLRQSVPMIEEKYLRLDGSSVDVEVIASPFMYKGKPSVQVVVRNIAARKRTEEALRESEERYRELYENASIGIYRTTPDGSILLANPRLIGMLGYSSLDEMRAHNLEREKFEPSYQRTDFKKKMELEGEVRGLESAWRRQDGSTIFVRENASAVRGQDNSILYYDGIAEDITEYKRAEESLRKSEELFKMLVESSPIAIAVFSGTTKDIEYVSHRFTQLFGYEQQDIPSLDSWWSHAYPIEEYRNQIESIWNNSVEQAQLDANDTEPLESVITCKDGSSKYIESTFSSMGELTLVFFSDLTQHRMAAEALRQTHAFNDLLIQTMPFGMNIVDEEGNILFISKTMKELLTVNAVDMCCWKVYKDDEQQCQACPLKRGISFGKPEVIETTGVLGGKTFQISHVGMMYEGRKAMLEVFQDITEQKKLQQELVQSQKMLSIGTLAGGIAHDFNNILGIILGYTSILHSMKNNPQKFSDGVNAIKQAVDRGASLVRQILTFARKTDVAFGPLDVPGLIQELVSMLQQTFSKTITFNKEIEIQLPLINADHTQIHQILLNLCVNARDAMPNGGVITIKAYIALGNNLRERFPMAIEQRYICLSVSDTGTGMDETTRNRIFDPFFTTKEKGKGTGLGLSVVYGVVQAHHGFVDVESTVGSGTSFQLYLPIPKESISAPETTKAEDRVYGGKETILIVEDEDLLLDMVQILLESYGYHVLTAKDGIEAVKVYSEHAHEIALVMSDMGLPKLSGEDEFKKLKEINPAVRMILASGFFEPDIKAKLEDAGVRGFLPKPYIIEDVLAKIREALD